MSKHSYYLAESFFVCGAWWLVDKWFYLLAENVAIKNHPWGGFFKYKPYAFFAVLMHFVQAVTFFSLPSTTMVVV